MFRQYIIVILIMLGPGIVVSKYNNPPFRYNNRSMLKKIEPILRYCLPIERYQTTNVLVRNYADAKYYPYC